MGNRMADLVVLFRMLNDHGIKDESPEMEHITNIINNEYDYGYRQGVYATTGKMGEREYGKGKHKP